MPGSRWSGIARTIEDNITGFNTSDRSAEKQYTHHAFSGHVGAYFGKEMEYDSCLDDSNYLDSAWVTPGGTRLIKSHDWAYKLDDIKALYPNDWIMLVYRPDASSYEWWFEAGGFQISYPNYSWYKNHAKMLAEITIQNNCILEFGHKHNVTWEYFTPQWLSKQFNQTVELTQTWPDILVAIIK